MASSGCSFSSQCGEQLPGMLSNLSPWPPEALSASASASASARRRVPSLRCSGVGLGGAWTRALSLRALSWAGLDRGILRRASLLGCSRCLCALLEGVVAGQLASIWRRAAGLGSDYLETASACSLPRASSYVLGCLGLPAVPLAPGFRKGGHGWCG